MTEQLYTQNRRKILQNKKLLENSLKVKISVQDDTLFFDGEAKDEFLALRVFEAIDLGFSINKALLLTDEDYVFEKVLMKKVTRRKDMSQVRARVIGTNRKALDTIESLTDCFVVVHENTIGVIGRLEDVNNALFALKRIVAGSNHANMYAWLEKKRLESSQAW